MPHRNQCDTHLVWPEITENYTDEFGPIDADIHKLAGFVWPLAKAMAARVIQDAEEGQKLLTKAAAIATRRYHENHQDMDLTQGYLFTIFRHLLMEEKEKRVRHSRLDEVVPNQSDETFENVEKDLVEKILIHEILERADEWTSEIFEWYALGYSFEEIARQKEMNSNLLRSRWSKKMRRLADQIRGEIRIAERRFSRRQK